MTIVKMNIAKIDWPMSISIGKKIIIPNDPVNGYYPCSLIKKWIERTKQINLMTQLINVEEENSMLSIKKDYLIMLKLKVKGVKCKKINGNALTG
jgi:hypothetical protein